jgi:hypothetical protein
MAEYLDKSGLSHLVGKIKTLFSGHTSNKSNPHGVTKSQVGLGSVANLDQSKAIKSITRSGTTFTATALDGTTTTFTQQDNNTTYTYNTDGTVATTSMASTDGTETCTTTYTYDSNGNVTKTVSTIKVGSNSYTKTVTFTYDSSNNVTKHSVTYS